MPRQGRFRIADIPQHLIVRGNDRRACFFEPDDYLRYLELLREASSKYRCEIHAYVLMTNHIHLLVTPRTPESISLMMQGVGRRYVRTINSKYRRTGTLFEGRYKSTVVSSVGYVLQCYRYIELNPVRAGIVTEPGAYSWSSHGHNALGFIDQLVTEQAVYVELGRTARTRREYYYDFLREHTSEDELTHIRRSTQTGWPMGNNRFKSEIETMLRRKVPCNTWGGIRLGAGRKTGKPD